MTRRDFWQPARIYCLRGPSNGRKTHLDKSRISAITDEIGLSTLEAIAFAHLRDAERRNP